MFSPGLIQPRWCQALALLAEATQLRVAAVLAWVLDEAPPVPLRGQRCDRLRPAFIREQLIAAINAQRSGAAVIDWHWDAGSQSVAGLLLNGCGVHDFRWWPTSGEISLRARIGLQQMEWLPLEAGDAWDSDSDDSDGDPDDGAEDQHTALAEWIRTITEQPAATDWFASTDQSAAAMTTVIPLRSRDGDEPEPSRQS